MSLTERIRGLLILFYAFFRAAPMAYGCSQAASVTYTTAHGNARSLTHWAGAGIEPASSWLLVRFVTAESQQELQMDFLKNTTLYFLSAHC